MEALRRCCRIGDIAFDRIGFDLLCNSYLQFKI